MKWFFTTVFLLWLPLVPLVVAQVGDSVPVIPLSHFAAISASRSLPGIILLLLFKINSEVVNYLVGIPLLTVK